MTTVAAYADGQTVWMAADSSTAIYDRPVNGTIRKIVRVSVGDDEVLLGLAGAAALADMLRYELQLPPPASAGEDPQAWAWKIAKSVTELAVRLGVVEDGKIDANLMLGWSGRVWTLAHMTAVLHPDGIAAIGTGEGSAVGAMDALQMSGCSPAELVVTAVQIACIRDRYSEPPIQLEVLSRRVEADVDD